MVNKKMSGLIVSFWDYFTFGAAPVKDILGVEIAKKDVKAMLGDEIKIEIDSDYEHLSMSPMSPMSPASEDLITEEFELIKAEVLSAPSSPVIIAQESVVVPELDLSTATEEKLSKFNGLPSIYRHIKRCSLDNTDWSELQSERNDVFHIRLCTYDNNYAFNQISPSVVRGAYGDLNLFQMCQYLAGSSAVSVPEKLCIDGYYGVPSSKVRLATFCAVVLNININVYTTGRRVSIGVRDGTATLDFYWAGRWYMLSSNYDAVAYPDVRCVGITI